MSEIMLAKMRRDSSQINEPYNNERCDQLLGGLLLDSSNEGDEVGYQAEYSNKRNELKWPSADKGVAIVSMVLNSHVYCRWSVIVVK